MAWSETAVAERLQRLLQQFAHVSEDETALKLHKQLDLLTSSHLKDRLLIPSNIHYIKYLARLHGLPKSFSKLIVANLQNLNDFRHALKLIHITKYSVQRNKSFITIAELSSVLLQRFPLETIGQRDDIFIREIVSQILLIIIEILAQLTPTAIESVTSALKTLSDYMPIVNTQYKSHIKSHFEILKQFVDKGEPEVRKEELDEFDGRRQLVQSGLQAIQSLHQNYMTRNGIKVQAHAVKTQQQEIALTEDAVSKKTELRKINIATALENSRSQSQSAAADQDTIQANIKQKSGSERRFWKTTAVEVSSFLQKAKSEKTISDEDIKYLGEKFANFKYSIFETDLSIKYKISQIFLIISKTHKLTDETINTLLNNATTLHLKDTLLFERSRGGYWEKFTTNILNATFHYCAKHQHLNSKTRELLEKFRDDDQSGATAEMKEIIFRIFRINEKDYEKNFKEALDHLKKDKEKASNHIAYIYCQVANEERCESLSKNHNYIHDMVQVICPHEDDYSLEVKLAAIEIVKSYVSMKFSTGLDSEDVGALIVAFQRMDIKSEENRSQKELKWAATITTSTMSSVKDELKKDKITTALLTTILRCIMISFEKNQSKSEYFDSLSDKFELIIKAGVYHADLKLQTIALAGLSNLAQNIRLRQFVISKLLNHSETLAEKLHRGDKVDKDGRVFLEEYIVDDDIDDENERFGCISADVAQLLIYILEASQSRNSVEMSVSQRLNDPNDIQTRILCSEYLFKLAKSGQLVDFTVLDNIAKCTFDTVPDVQVYSSAAYCTAISSLDLTNSDNLNGTVNRLQVLAGIYSVKNVRLGDKDFTIWINPKIIDVLSYCSKHAQLTEQMFQVLTHNLSKSVETCNGEYVQDVEKVFQAILNSFRETDGQSSEIPDMCLETIEHLMFKFDTLVQPCSRIFDKCLQAGQWVSSEVIIKFSTFLYDDVPLAKPYIERLFLANLNQELPDHLFADVHAEILGLRLHQELFGKPERFLIDYGLAGGDSVKMLAIILQNQSNGKLLSPLNLENISQCLRQDVHVEQALQSLIQASRNGQNLPEYVINLAFQKYPSFTHLKIELGIAVFARNQMLPEEFLKKFYREFTSGKASSGEASLIIAMIDSNKELPLKVVTSFCQKALDQARNSSNLDTNVASAVLKIAEMELNNDIIQIVKRVLFIYFEKEDTVSMKMGLRGLEKLPQGVLTSLEIQNVKAYAAKKCLEFHPKFIKTEKLSAVTNLDDQLITDIRLHLNQPVQEKDDALEVFKLDKFSVENVDRILTNDPSRRKTLFSILNDTFSKPVLKPQNHHAQLIEAVCFFVATHNGPSEGNSRGAGYEIIKKAVRAGFQLSESAIRSLNFFGFLTLDSDMCLFTMKVLSDMIPDQIICFPNVEHLIDCVYMQTLSIGMTCLQVLNSNENMNLNQQCSKILIDNGAMSILCALINHNKSIRAMTYFMFLVSNGRLELPPYMNTIHIILHNMQSLCSQSQLQLIDLIPKISDPKYVALVLQAIENVPSELQPLIYSALFAIDKQNGCLTRYAGWNAFISGRFKSCLEMIDNREEHNHDEIQLLDRNFQLSLLIALTCAQNWDFKNLRNIPCEKWIENIILSDLVVRFATSENDKVEICSLLKSIFLKLILKCPILYVKLMNMLSQLKGQISGFILLKFLEEFSTDEFSLLSEDFNIWLEQVLIIGLAKRLKPIFNVPTKVRLMAADSILQTFGRDTKFALDFVSSISHIENAVSLNYFLQFATGSKGQFLKSSLKALKLLPVNSRTLHELQVLASFQSFVDIFPSKYPKIDILKENVKALLRRDYSCESLRSLILPACAPSKDTKDETKANNVDILENVIFQLVNYDVNYQNFEQILKFLLATDVTAWIAKCRDEIFLNLFEGSKGVKNVEQTITEFLDKNTDTGKRKAEYEKEISVILNPEANSIILPQKSIKTWEEKEIRLWAQQFRIKCSESSEISLEELILDFLQVANRVCKVQNNFNFTPNQVLCLLSILKKKEKGLILQMGTGSGKSIIIAVSATFFALQRNQVDVFTSSPVLAERDARKWASFYNFFGLTCSHNGESGHDDKGRRKCYEADVVYGDTSQFQFDTLRDEYNGLGTRAKRRYNYCIIDEVDCMLIDDSLKLARISTTLPGMDLLHVLYIFIWEQLDSLQKHIFVLGEVVFYLDGRISGYTYEFTDENGNIMRIDDIPFFLLENSSDAHKLKYAKIDKIGNNANLNTFVSEKLTAITKSLISRDTDQSSVDKNQNTGETQTLSHLNLPEHLKTFATSQVKNWVESALTALTFQENIHYIVDDNLIKPVDYATTGVIQASTSWNNGLHQFLQIKHELRITSETVTSNYLSNMAMFKKYGKNVIGLTGTLGTEHGRSILEEIYNVDTVLIPDMHFKRFRGLREIVTSTYKEWSEFIVHSALHEVSKGRGVLIISQTIKQSKQISDALVKENKSVASQLYFRNDKNQEKRVEVIKPGEIIIATNLAGRGTDIVTSSIETFGGLHVILTFMPTSLRVEEQAFGRTSRQSNQGTGQLIVMDPELQSFKDVLTKRDTLEKTTLEDFKNNQYLRIKTKDELFEKFSRFYREKKVDVSTDFSLLDNFTNHQSRAFTNLHLQAIEEKWAIFLKRIDQDEIKIEDAEKEYADLEARMKSDIENNNVLTGSSNPFYLVQRGNEFYRKKSKITNYNDYVIQARQCFEKLNNLPSALLGNAYCLLHSTFFRTINNPTTNKTKALELLGKALEYLNYEIANLVTAATLLLNRTQRKNSELMKQLETKINFLTAYKEHIQKNVIRPVEKSLRPVVCAGFKDGRQTHVKKLINDQVLPFQGICDQFSLTFHNLTAHWDLYTTDQAKQTIKTIKGADVSLTLNGLDISKAIKDTQVEELLKQSTAAKMWNSIDQIKTNTPEIKLSFTSINTIQSVQSIYETFTPNSCCITIKSTLEFLKSVNFFNTFKGNKITLRYPTDKGEDNFCHIQPHQDTPSSPEFNELGCEKCEVSVLVKDKNDIGLIVGSLQQINFGTTFEIKFNIKGEDCLALRDLPENTSLTLSCLNPSDATKTIDTFRKLKIEFLLGFEKLSQSTAKTILEKAALQQNDIKQETLESQPKNSTFNFLRSAKNKSSDVSQTDTKEEQLNHKPKFDVKHRELFCDPFEHLSDSELLEYTHRGLSLLPSFSERGVFPWKTMAAVGVVTLVAGVFGGVALFNPGTAQLILCLSNYLANNMAWSDFAKDVALTVGQNILSGNINLQSVAKVISFIFLNHLVGLVPHSGTILGAGKYVLSQVLSATDGTQTDGSKQSPSVYKPSDFTDTAQTFLDFATSKAFAAVLETQLLQTIQNFSFQQLQPNIENLVISQLNTLFQKQPFQTQLYRFCAVSGGSGKVDTNFISRANSAINSKAPDWSKRWDSLIQKLVRCVITQIEWDKLPLGIDQMDEFLEEHLVVIVNEVGTMVEQSILEVNKKYDSPPEANKKGGLLKTIAQSLQKGNPQADDIRDKLVVLITEKIIGSADRTLSSPSCKSDIEIRVADLMNSIQSARPASEGQKIDSSQDKSISYREERNLKTRALILKTYENEEKITKDGPGFEDVHNILGNGPAGLITMVKLSQKHDLNVKIVRNPNYKVTQEELEAEVALIVYRIPNDVNQEGYFLRGSQERNNELTSCDGQFTSGFEILSSLSGQSVHQLRSEAAEMIINDKDSFMQLKEYNGWFQLCHTKSANHVEIIKTKFIPD